MDRVTLVREVKSIQDNNSMSPRLRIKQNFLYFPNDCFLQGSWFAMEFRMLSTDLVLHSHHPGSNLAFVTR